MYFNWVMMRAYLKLDTEKDGVLPSLVAMLDKMSHLDRFVGNGGHGVSFFSWTTAVSHQ